MSNLVPHQQATPPRLASQNVVLAAPFSFTGSARRIWKLTRTADNDYARAALGIAAVTLIAAAWMLVASWYMTFGLLVVPYRLVRRGQRRDRMNALRHQEMLIAMASQQATARQLAHPPAAAVATAHTTPPGWYPDFHDPGSLRYWDGHGWTEHRQPIAPS